MPLTEMVPAVGLSRSAMTLSRVVLPHPEGPMKETNSPFPMARSTFDSAWTGPSLVWNARPRPLASMTDSVAGFKLAPASAERWALEIWVSNTCRRNTSPFHLARRGDLLPGRQCAVDRLVGFARHELAMTRFRFHPAVIDRQIAPGEDETRQPRHLHSFEHVVVDD